MTNKKSTESLSIFIKKIHLTNFKSYSDAHFELDRGLNFITGVNGSGKTNLLDALHYMCITRSFLHASDRLIVKSGEAFMRLDATLGENGAEHRIVAKVSPGKLKQFEQNGVQYERLSEHIGRIPVIILSPKDHMLIEGSRIERRKFMDFYLSQTSHAYLSALHHYNRHLNQRNAHLKEWGRRADNALMQAYSEKMLPHASVLISQRAEFIDSIRPMVEARCDTLSMERDHVRLSYRPDCTEREFLEMSVKSADKDRILQRTNVGPHRDDLEFGLDDQALRKFGSQGQMKTYLIALHLALHGFIKSHLGKVPIILLDDIFDKLDDDRTLNLTHVLNSSDFGQVVITDARDERVKRIADSLEVPAKIIHIRPNRQSDEEE